jgi:hypothetical protein
VVTSKASSKKADSSVSWRRLRLIGHSQGYLSWSETTSEKSTAGLSSPALHGSSNEQETSGKTVSQA